MTTAPKDQRLATKIDDLIQVVNAISTKVELIAQTQTYDKGSAERHYHQLQRENEKLQKQIEGVQAFGRHASALGDFVNRHKAPLAIIITVFAAVIVKFGDYLYKLQPPH